MATEKPNLQVQQGVEIPQPEKGRLADWLFNKTNFFRQMVSAVNGWLNLNVLVTVKQLDGTSKSYAAIQPSISAKKSTLTIPLDAADFGNTTGSVNNGVYGGSGPPGSTTLPAGINFSSGQNPTLYVDESADGLYYCSLSGTNQTAIWRQISSNNGSGTADTYDNGKAYLKGTIVRVESAGPYSSTFATIGVWFAAQNVPALGIGAQIPQWPEPINPFWKLICFGVQMVPASPGSGTNVLVHSSNPY